MVRLMVTTEEEKQREGALRQLNINEHPHFPMLCRQRQGLTASSNQRLRWWKLICSLGKALSISGLSLILEHNLPGLPTEGVTRVSPTGVGGNVSEGKSACASALQALTVVTPALSGCQMVCSLPGPEATALCW